MIFIDAKNFIALSWYDKVHYAEKKGGSLYTHPVFNVFDKWGSPVYYPMWLSIERQRIGGSSLSQPFGIREILLMIRI